MCGDCFVCIYLVCQCDGLELGRRNRRITVRGVAVRINTDLSLPSEDEEEEVKSNNAWEYAIDIFFKLASLHPEGKCLRKWVKHQNMENMESFYHWNQNWITIGEPHTSYLENSWHIGTLEFLKTIFMQNLHMLSKYLHHLVKEAKESSIPGNPFSVLLPDQFCNLTWKEFMKWRLEDSNQNTSSVSSTGHQGYTKQDSRYKSSQNSYQLLAFKKSIKSEVSQ